MISDFIYGWENKNYGKRDLEIGLQYAQDLIKFEHLEKEPFHYYDLRKFIKWCKMKLKNE